MTTLLTWLIPPGVLVFFALLVLRQNKRGKASFLDWITFERATEPKLFRIAQGTWGLFGLFLFLLACQVVYFG